MKFIFDFGLDFDLNTKAKPHGFKPKIAIMTLHIALLPMKTAAVLSWAASTVHFLPGCTARVQLD